LRHCISAHPINYNQNGSKTSFRIDRSSLNDNGLITIRNESNSFLTYNIYTSLDNYILNAETCLRTIAKKIISNCYQTSKEKFNELNAKLDKI
jgi:hypothetical protein